MKWFFTIILTAAAALPTGALAQTSSHVPGTVAAVDAKAGQVTVKTEKGDSLTFTTTERTQILHAQAGVTDPKQWTKMAVGDIGMGDEVVAYFRGAADAKPLIATTLVIRTKTDLSTLEKSELDDWKKRGTTGIVEAVDPAAHTITLKAGARTIKVDTGDKTQFHRYSLDSAKPADAKPSSLAEIKAGDQVNVLGNKTPDGNTVTAEVVYAGTFRQIAATIISINLEKGEMEVHDLADKNKKAPPLFIRITPDTNMKKLPEQLAAMLARRYQGGRAGGPGGEGRGGFGGGEGRGMGRGMGAPGGGRGGDIGAMLDRLPTIPLTELKPKDAIMVSTTMGSDPSKVTAIMLLAGVEPVLTAAPTATRDIMSGWNLGGGGGGGEGQ
jgi:Cu/Ag efflux protein CusF